MGAVYISRISFARIVRRRYGIVEHSPFVIALSHSVRWMVGWKVYCDRRAEAEGKVEPVGRGQIPELVYLTYCRQTCVTNVIIGLE